MRKLKFLGFDYQVVSNGQSVLVFNDEKSARSYAEKYFKGTSVMILPIAVFTYDEGGKA